MDIGIPQFSLDPSIDYREGKIDRVQIEYGPIPFDFDHAEHGQTFADHLSVPPTKERMGPTGERYGRLFRRYTGRQRYELVVRETPILLSEGLFERPLFSGVLKILKSRNSPKSVGYMSLRLNPTRFLRYQKLRSVLTGGLPELRAWKPTLFANYSDPPDREEFEFDGNDNWIAPVIYKRAGSARLSLPLFKKYLNGVFDTVNAEIARAGRMVSSNPTFAESVMNLRSSEIYWEFADANPVTTASRIFQSLGTISDEQSWRKYRGRYRAQGKQSVIYGYKLASGIWLYIYAKTNERIRFEIRYDLTKAAKIIGGKHTCKNRTELTRYVENLRKDAATRLKDFFAFLRAEMLPSKFPVPATAFVSRIISVVNNYQMALPILEKLVHEKGIPVSANSPFKRYLRRLTKENILACHRNVYRLTREYRDAARSLEQADILTLALPNCQDRRRINQ